MTKEDPKKKAEVMKETKNTLARVEKDGTPYILMTIEKKGDTEGVQICGTISRAGLKLCHAAIDHHLSEDNTIDPLLKLLADLQAMKNQLKGDKDSEEEEQCNCLKCSIERMLNAGPRSHRGA